MADFLKDELSGLPAAVNKAMLAELEAIIRSVRFTTIYDDTSSASQRHDLQCIRTCARIASVLQLASRLREGLVAVTKANAD